MNSRKNTFCAVLIGLFVVGCLAPAVMAPVTDAYSSRNSRWIHTHHICDDEPGQHGMLRGTVRRSCGFYG